MNKFNCTLTNKKNLERRDTVEQDQAKSYDEMISRFSDQINSTKTSLTIVTGEAHCKIYNAEPVRKALFDAMKRGVRIRAMMGPSVSIDETGTNTMLELIGKDYVEIYRRKARSIIHSRVMDKRNAYIELPHKPGAGPHERKMMNVKEDEQEFWANTLEQEFDYQVRKKIAEKVKSKNDFVFVKLEDYENIVEKANHQGKNFDFLTKEDLILLISKH